MHLAGYKAVGDAVEDLLKYYETTLRLPHHVARVVDNYGVRRLCQLIHQMYIMIKRCASSRVVRPELA